MGPPLPRYLRPWDEQLGGPTPTGDEDRAWAEAHPHGYGSVDAPSPWGYDRTAFDDAHPGYAGGFYNPSSGFYDAHAEVPFQASGPTGPETIGTGGLPDTGGHEPPAPPPSFDGAMPGAQPSMPGTDEHGSPVDAGGEHGQDDGHEAVGQSFSDALSQYLESLGHESGQGDQQTSTDSAGSWG